MFLWISKSVSPIKPYFSRPSSVGMIPRLSRCLRPLIRSKRVPILFRLAGEGVRSSITGRRRGMAGIPPPTWRSPASACDKLKANNGGVRAPTHTPIPREGRTPVSRVIRKGNADYTARRGRLSICFRRVALGCGRQSEPKCPGGVKSWQIKWSAWGDRFRVEICLVCFRTY